MYKPQTSQNCLNLDPIWPHCESWQMLQNLSQQRDPKRHSDPTSLWGAVVVVDRRRCCHRGLWSRCAEAAAAGDRQPRAGRSKPWRGFNVIAINSINHGPSSLPPLPALISIIIVIIVIILIIAIIQKPKVLSKPPGWGRKSEICDEEIWKRLMPTWIYCGTKQIMPMDRGAKWHGFRRWISKNTLTAAGAGGHFTAVS